MRVTPSSAAVLLLLACRAATNSLSDDQSEAIADTAVSEVVARISEAVAQHDADLGLGGLNSKLIWAEDGWYTANQDSVEAAIRMLLGSMHQSRLECGTRWVEVHAPDTAVVSATFRWNVVDTLGVTNFVDGAFSVMMARTAMGWKIVRGSG